MFCVACHQDMSKKRDTDELNITAWSDAMDAAGSLSSWISSPSDEATFRERHQYLSNAGERATNPQLKALIDLIADVSWDGLLATTELRLQQKVYAELKTPQQRAKVKEAEAKAEPELLSVNDRLTQLRGTLAGWKP